MDRGIFIYPRFQLQKTSKGFGWISMLRKIHGLRFRRQTPNIARFMFHCTHYRNTVLEFLRALSLGFYAKRNIARFVHTRYKKKRLEAANEYLVSFCMYYVTSSTKEATKMWKQKGEPATKKNPLDKSANNLIGNVFWDCHCIIHVE